MTELLRIQRTCGLVSGWVVVGSKNLVTSVRVSRSRSEVVTIWAVIEFDTIQNALGWERGKISP